MGDQKIRTHTLTILGHEKTKMCGIKKQCLLQSSSPEAMASFHWSQLESELKLCTPSLFSILESDNTAKVRPSKVRKKTRRVKQNQTTGISAAILFRHHNHSMNLVHHILSVLLYNGRASKQVRYSIIQLALLFTAFQLFR